MLARHIIVLLPLVATALASPLIIETRSDPHVHGALSLRGSHEDAAQQGHAKRDDEDAAERGYTKRADDEDASEKGYSKRRDDEDAVNVYHKRADDEDAAEKGYSKRSDGE